MKKTLLIVFIVVLGIFVLRNLKLRIPHPFPKLTKQISLVDKLDKYLHLTMGIEWYKVTEKSTEKEYLFWYGYDNERRIETLYIMDYETRKEFIPISRKEFLERFEQPVMGEARSIKDFKTKGE